MAVKIRLARHGKKGYPFYHIVVADSRAPRDGRFIEKLGTYNPNTNPATIELDVDSAVSWLTKGAQPTDTCRSILSYKGALLKKHLMEGVKKGALTEELVKQRFEAWLDEKESKIQAKKSSLAQANRNDAKARIEEESKVKEAKAAALAQKQAEARAAEAAVKAAAEASKEAPAAEENTEA
ncbi:MAG: 30S ribosomal protein S16 [Prevotellaceae bacterium]|jgi:small subunit ribosomal protein S16|nr:30S ribosomal protein S16 [Prevotellaceae bacterium]